MNPSNTKTRYDLAYVKLACRVIAAHTYSLAGRDYLALRELRGAAKVIETFNQISPSAS